MFTIDVDAVGIYECRLICEDWHFPVGENGYPPRLWYAASLHSLDGSLNFNGYRHTGIDLNIDQPPYGDTERVLGLSVYAVTTGTVKFITDRWSGVPMLVMQARHNDKPIWIRYGHIIPVVKLNETVLPGDKIGSFANYQLGGGGDHLHFDMATDRFTTEWLSSDINWLDPVEVLKEHLNPITVDEMLKKD